ncbi:cytochrome-c peroxidase [Acidocella sp.]|uniref:cytochrome-c peroxidase n=1 Tax=Acidocella sp. TaxID=50710 RepID=UPI002617176E|nr:cytochrome c peroxidase [Acidocella sp.]
MRPVLAALALVAALALCIALAFLLRSPLPLRAWLAQPAASLALARGFNPRPAPLARPPRAPLSAMARLGRMIFYDPGFSASGRLSCASCHSPTHFYGPPGAAPAMMGGPRLDRQGVRAVPSLMYLATQPSFSIGPEPAGDDDAPAPLFPPPAARPRPAKTPASAGASAASLVPQGGLFWDGRAQTLQGQALGPMLNPLEMDGSLAAIAARLGAPPYAERLVQLFGPASLADPGLMVSEAMFALARFQVEDESFHPFTSKYDAWLEGRARFSPAELRGYLLFNDPAKGNCAACHLDQPAPDGAPPLFTDHQFEALGLPRNPHLRANANPAYADLGLCGPYRADFAGQSRYCGMFLTPTLRDAAARRVFFHNGVYHSLREVLDFYDFRDTDPARIYPRAADGRVEIFNDLPRADRANIDTTDPPFTRHLGEAPPLTPAEERDIIAFLQSLTDGYGRDPADSGGGPR